jgi:hypothetical protein
MITFRIDPNPKTALGLDQEALDKPESERIRRVPEPTRPPKSWPGPRIVEISNTLPGQKPVKKVSNEGVARLVARSRAQGARALRVAPHKVSKRAKPTRTGRTRAGTKTAKILDLLRRPGGATLKQLMTATKWQAHSVRGFLSAALKKKRGLTVESTKRVDGERTYAIKV